MIFRTDWDTFETFSIPLRRENRFFIAECLTEIAGFALLRLLQAFSFTVTFIVKENAYKSLNNVKSAISVEKPALKNIFSGRNGIENVSSVS